MLDGATSRGLKPREERRNVIVPARMRIGARWLDATILNMSSKGLLVFAKAGAEPGSYVEIRRGEQVIVARVVWRRNQRIGLASQGKLSIEQIVSGKAVVRSDPGSGGRVERRAKPRLPDESRLRGRAIEFVSAVAAAVAIAGLVVGTVERTLAAPMTKIQTALKPD